MPIVKNKAFTLFCDQCDNSVQWDGGETFPQPWLQIVEVKEYEVGDELYDEQLSFCDWACLAAYANERVRNTDTPERYEIPWAPSGGATPYKSGPGQPTVKLDPAEGATVKLSDKGLSMLKYFNMPWVGRKEEDEP